MQAELQAWGQAYVICPLIEESDKMDVQNAVDVYEQLTAHYKERYTVGLMHGRLHSDEKDNIMRQFSEGVIDVLFRRLLLKLVSTYRMRHLC